MKILTENFFSKLDNLRPGSKNACKCKTQCLPASQKNFELQYYFNWWALVSDLVCSHPYCALGKRIKKLTKKFPPNFRVLQIKKATVLSCSCYFPFYKYPSSLQGKSNLASLHRLKEGAKEVRREYQPEMDYLTMLHLRKKSTALQ